MIQSSKSDNKDKDQTNPDPQRIKQQNARLKYFIQAIDIKEDRNMTRIYSALQQIKNT